MYSVICFFWGGGAQHCISGIVYVWYSCDLHV